MKNSSEIILKWTMFAFFILMLIACIMYSKIIYVKIISAFLLGLITGAYALYKITNFIYKDKI